MTGRGVVVASDIAIADVKFALKIVDELEIRIPGQKSFKTHCRGIEMASPFNPRRLFTILLSDVTKDMPPIGAEVWSVGDALPKVSLNNGE
jgi:hypothetical protein